MQWPPDYLKIQKERISLLQSLNSNEELRADVMLHYKDNPVDWINDWCITIDPRKKNAILRKMPFILFQRQIEFVGFLRSCLDDRESGLVEKARDIGASWICCAFSVWLWLFHEGTTIGWGSRKEEYVDKNGDPKAIFPKMRQIIDELPAWMRPHGFDMRVHGTYMKIINPVSGSVITGEAGNSIGRGGRTTIFFKDESAHYENPELIEAALGDNTDVQIDISSVNGSANIFYRRRMAGEIWSPSANVTPGKTRVFIFDWRDHPAKTQEWYDQRRVKAESEGMLHVFAQEVDRDYSGSIVGVIIPQEWVKAAIDAHIKLKIAISGDKAAMQDIADGGGDKNALVARHGILCNYADHWGGEAGPAAERAVPQCVELGVNQLYYDSIGVGSGFKTQINTMKERPAWPSQLRVFPWNAAAKVLDPEDNIIPNDYHSPLNKDQYKNLKAQAWFRVRSRFYKTYRAVMFGEQYDPAELISIDSRLPLLHQLCLELSQAVQKNPGDGKIIVDKKPEGATSPNLADAFVGVYNPVMEVSILDVL